MIFAGVAMAITAGLVVAEVAHERSERERDAARSAVCTAVAELYRSAFDGPVPPGTKEEWEESTDRIAAQLSALNDPFDMSTQATKFRNDARNRRPSLIRKAARGVGCARSTFPPVQSAVFDTTPAEWVTTATAPAVEPAVVHLSGAQLSPESAVATNIRGATFQTLANAGVPIDMIPLLDLSQARIAWINNGSSRDYMQTTIRFVTKVDVTSSAVHQIVAVAASLPDMAGAEVDESRWLGSLWSADDKVSIRVSMPEGDEKDTDVIEIQRSALVRGTVLPPALEQTATYAVGPLTGAQSEFDTWWVQLGTDPKSKKPMSSTGLSVIVEQAVEPVMDSIARSIGAWKQDGSHLFGERLLDPTHHEFYWKILGVGLGSTVVYVVQKAHAG